MKVLLAIGWNIQAETEAFHSWAVISKASGPGLKSNCDALMTTREYLVSFCMNWAKTNSNLVGLTKYKRFSSSNLEDQGLGLAFVPYSI